MVKAPTPGSKAFDLQQMRERRAKQQAPNNRHATARRAAPQEALKNLTESTDSKPSSAPVQASAQQPEPEDTMAKKKTKAKPAGKKRGVGEAAANRKKAIQAAKAAKKSKPKKKAKAPKAAGESDRGDTQRKIGELLCRPEGATAKDVLALTGWDAVSVPPVAKRLGITLRKEKVEGERGVRYFGTAAA